MSWIDKQSVWALYLSLWVLIESNWWNQTDKGFEPTVSMVSSLGMSANVKSQWELDFDKNVSQIDHFGCREQRTLSKRTSVVSIVGAFRPAKPDYFAFDSSVLSILAFHRISVLVPFLQSPIWVVLGTLLILTVIRGQLWWDYTTTMVPITLASS